VGRSACVFAPYEHRDIFITLDYPVFAIALLSSRRAIAAAGVK
jgi:hypothetical protein